MDSRPSDSPVKNDTAQASVTSSSSAGEKQLTVPGGLSNTNTDKKDSKLLEQVQEMALESSSRDSNHMTTGVRNKSGMYEEEEEGELDYEEDEGEISGAHDNRNGVKNDVDGDKEEGELEEDGNEEEGEEGEILSDDDEDDKGTASEKKSQESQDSTVTETDGPEEGEVIEEGDSPGGQQSLRRKVCRYFMHGGCTWGMSCRFLHPGLNDKGAYQMLPIPGQYPSPFPKPPSAVPPVPPESMVQAHGLPSLPGQDDGQMEDEFSDRIHLIPEVVAPPKKETAWERGLKLAKEIKKAAQKRKEEDADFQEKRMILGITADENEDENDKENLIRRREIMRARLEKDAMFDEGDVRHRRGGDIVSRWRDKKQLSPDRERDKRKRRGNRSPSSSPERDRRNRRRGGEKEKQKGKVKEALRERDKQRTKTATKEMEKKSEEKVKKQKEKDSDSGKEKPVAEEEKNESAVIQEKGIDVKGEASSAEKKEIKTEEKKIDEEKRKRLPQEKTADFELKSGREGGKRDELHEADERDKPKTKALGISNSRLPNDEWMDPWQRKTSPKHSASSRSSRSRSSSSSSDSSHSRSRSHSGSESRSTSRSTSRSRSRSVSGSASRSSSRSRSGSRSNSRSRSGSVASGSDHSSSSGSSKEVKAAPDEGGEDKDAQKASHDSSESESESDKSGSKSKSPTPAQKSPAKPKTSPDRGPRTPPVESSAYRNAKDRKNRYEYNQAEKVQKWQEGQMRQGSGPWERRVERARGPVEGSYSRDRAHNSRRKRSPEIRRRSRSPRRRNEERRRADEGRARERSSSADSMEHALARPSSPRATRERGGMRRGSSVSSSGSDSASSDSGSESEEERHPVRTRRALPEADQFKQAPVVPLSSGNIRYTGHKDIKLTLNKSVARTDNREPLKSQSQHSLPARTEPSGEKLQAVTRKRTRDPSPVSEHTKEMVSSSVTTQSTIKPDKRSANPQAEPVSSGKANSANTSSRREELLRELKAVEDAIARKRARIE